MRLLARIALGALVCLWICLVLAGADVYGPAFSLGLMLGVGGGWLGVLFGLSLRGEEVE